MNNDLEKYRGYIVTAISTIPPDRDIVIEFTEVCNKIIDDIDEFNSDLIQEVLSGNPKTKTEFEKQYNISVNDISAFKLPGYNVP